VFRLLQLWLRYPLCWLGLTRLGRYEDVQAIIAIAFGRNNLPETELNRLWEFRQQFGQANGADHLAIAALRDKGFNPGRPNHGLATVVQKAMARSRRFCYLQWEVATALDPAWYNLNWRWVKVIWPANDGAYLSTRDILLAIKPEMITRQETEAAIIAHQGMIVRVALLARRQLGLNPIIPEQDINEFDRNSVQPWTRQRWAWLKRETLARAHHLLHRWV